MAETSNRRQTAARRREQNSGSAVRNTAPSEFLAIGRLQKPHGLNGELQMGVMTDFPERIKKGKKVYIGENHQEVTIKNTRHHNVGLLITFQEFSHRDEVEHIRNWYVYVRIDELPKLPRGEYYQHQLYGLQVETEDGLQLGTLTEIIETGANNVYVITSDDKPDVLLPSTHEVILNIDLKNKTILVHLLPGLLPEDFPQN